MVSDIAVGIMGFCRSGGGPLNNRPETYGHEESPHRCGLESILGVVKDRDELCGIV